VYLFFYKFNPFTSRADGDTNFSFLVDSLDNFDIKWRRPPQSIQNFPYNGRKVGVTIGPAGEWIELIEE